MRRRQFITNSMLPGGAVLMRAFGAEDRSAGPDASSVAETKYGKVRGVTVRGTHVFKGIPYGGATEGPGRFLPPSKPARWPGVLDCTANGPRCVQGSGNIFLNPVIGEYFRGSEDRAELAPQRDSENCLVLNVLTPDTKGKRPVMVYIHGGGYTGGSGLLTVFADAFPREHDIVLVGINHRLNVFGYLYLGHLNENYSTGNAGQLDLISALQWVRDNIAGFGGDPGNVTIFGESGGGGKVSTLLAMPAAKGLFRRAIVESGSTLRVSTKERATETAKAVLARLGLDEKHVDKLQDISAADLYKAASQAGGPGAASRLQFEPVVDGHSVLEQTWDPKAPEAAAGIPMIIGCCKDETTLFSMNDQSLFQLDHRSLRDRVLKAGIPEGEADKLLAAYRRDHPQDSPADTWFRFSTDRGVRWNAVKQAELKLEQGRGDVYMYHFAWNTPCADGKIRAFHTAELPLALRLVRYPQAEQLSKQISGAWAAFARSGNPKHSGLPEWPRYSTEKRATMIFDVPRSEVTNDPDRDERLLLQNRPSRGLL